MAVVVGSPAPGEDGPIPVVVDVEAFTATGAPVTDADSLYGSEETRDGAGAARRALGAAGDLYGDGLDLARRCASQAMRRLGDLGDGLRPDEVELQVGITFEAGMAAVVKAGAEAQIQVTFRWQPGREEQAVAVVAPS
ncbi:CU044_2847 family protein [Streptomyces sp. NPDC006976]|uniref:CU044_2847 family protein n=1 Tax=Streptomyces castrisilvae TaxID=3033811 RepID=A0ABY9HPG7_9ACTN|nr:MULTISPECIES: CU044_2847 family protein [unclassified Streptomyces]WLQ36244.1 CU044_2847 family protein [Streptomyces sp. Mut1]